MSLLAWIVVGLIAGWLASMVMGGSGSLLMDLVVGMIGALIGGFLFNMVGAQGTTGLNLWSIFVAFVGAAILLWIVKAVQART